jgi:hypothetical protein
MEAQKMANRVYITRADHWENGGDAPIELSEWQSFVKANTEFKLAEPGSNRARWRLHPYGKTVVLQLVDGNVVVDDPDDYATSTLRFIAHQLDAEVQGKKGKKYF